MIWNLFIFIWPLVHGSVFPAFEKKPLYFKESLNSVTQKLKFNELVRSRKETKRHDVAMKDLSFIISGNIPRLRTQEMVANFQKAFCPACYLSAKSLLPIINTSWGAKSFIWSLKRLCITFHMFDEYICRGTIDLFKEEFVAILRTVRPDPRSVCQIVVSECYEDWNIFNKFNWSEVSLPEKTFQNDLQYPAGPSETLKVLHVTDIHIDLEYQAGTNVDCGQPLCCRAQSDGVENSAKAFYWGSRFSCDIPFRTFESALNSATKVIPEPDFILWTGDAPAHDIWAYSHGKSDFFLQNITSTFRKYYPTTKIYPVIGNHEGVPVNAFPDDDYWLYKDMATAWEEFRLEEQSYQSIARHGYYTELARPGFRIVAINSNFCNDENFWILTSQGDPGHQNQWLVDTLFRAEINGEKVALIGHIPPGAEDQIEACSTIFYQIVNRFSNTITSQFYGHTHWDHLKMFYQDYNQEQPTNIAYVSPSLTTWVGMDPAFRIYEMDSWNRINSTFAVLDHHTFTANVHIPADEELVFKHEYSAKSAYGLKDLSPKSWSELILKWQNGESTDSFEKYYFNKYHQNLIQKCTGTCVDETLCRMKMGLTNKNASTILCN